MTAGPDERSQRPTLRRRTAVLLAVVALFLLATSVAVLVSLVDLNKDGNEVINRWSPAYARSLTLLTNVLDQEAGVRAYALTRSPVHLGTYRTALRNERADEQALRSYIGDREPLRAQLGDVVRRAGRWRNAVVRPFLEDAGGRTVAIESRTLVGARAEQLFAATRQASTRLSDELSAVRDHAAAARVGALTAVWTSGGIAAALVVLAFPAIWIALQRAVLEPVERLAGQARAVAQGELERTIEPFGPLEVYRLGEDVDLMRARIGTELDRVDRARQVLAARSEELSRSNADLEQFAYVASHDLSEPLRKVANFCQLLERQYSAQLDDKARQYIGFAVDGAKRMQILIGDLLAFSRVGRTTEHFKQVRLDDALDRALANLDERVMATEATIERSSLPVIEGDMSLLTALFQNLVGNALKYRDPDRPPHVEITAERQDDRWLITVQDNGIGIDPQYGERIFVIFQRLHLRDQYGGTGIGLALCRRIVEFHGGSIWLGTSDRPGARFCFAVPERRDTADPTEV